MISLSTVLHTVSQSILYPCLLVLLILILVTIWQVGDVLMEHWLEHRKRCRDIPGLLEQLHDAGDDGIPKVLRQSSLLKRQRLALQKLLDQRTLNRTEFEVLAQRILSEEEQLYAKSLLVTDLVVRLGPMFGLLGTLIPLGPGIVALGHGDTAALAQSLGIAFDTTVVGIITAAVCSVISKLRKSWYEGYLLGLEAIMEYIVEARFSHVEK